MARDPSPPDPKLKLIVDLIGDELWKAMRLHSPLRSAHEGYAVILEELDELWDEVKKKREHRDRTRLRQEAVQVAAMAARFVYDLCDRNNPSESLT